MSAKAHSLKNKINSPDLILGDYHEVPGFMLSGQLIKLPDPASASYAHQMLTLCLDNCVTIIYVLDTNEASLLTETKQLFVEYDIQITTDEL